MCDMLGGKIGQQLLNGLDGIQDPAVRDLFSQLARSLGQLNLEPLQKPQQYYIPSPSQPVGGYVATRATKGSPVRFTPLGGGGFDVGTRFIPADKAVPPTMLVGALEFAAPLGWQLIVSENCLEDA
jgi:hypothetical protein